jgi:hypothetical protein
MKTTRSSKFTLLCLLLQSTLSFGFAPVVVVVPRFKVNNPTQLFMAGLPDGYQEFGTQAIEKAGEKCGATQGQLQIDWKAGRIIVTVLGDSYVSATDDDDGNDDNDNVESESGEEEDNEELDDDQEEQDKELEDDDDDDTEVTQSQELPTRGVDVTELAKAINLILDDGGVGLAIAEVHEIQVTTPGSSDELEGIMFTAYKGFDVIVQFMDSKTKKLKTVDGRLVERNQDFTVINIKGRMKNLKNVNVISVKLPKAKKEKGASR